MTATPFYEAAAQCILTSDAFSMSVCVFDFATVAVAVVSFMHAKHYCSSTPDY